MRTLQFGQEAEDYFLKQKNFMAVVATGPLINRIFAPVGFSNPANDQVLKSDQRIVRSFLGRASERSVLPDFVKQLNEMR